MRLDALALMLSHPLLEHSLRLLVLRGEGLLLRSMNLPRRTQKPLAAGRTVPVRLTDALPPARAAALRS